MTGDCADGFYSSTGQETCTACPIGFACPEKALNQETPGSTNSGMIDCSRVRGFYGDVTGLMACKPCDAGYECPLGQADRVECDDGKFSGPVAEYCMTCPIGHECPEKTVASLAPCLVGTFADDAAGQKECTICANDYECYGEVEE